MAQLTHLNTHIKCEHCSFKTSAYDENDPKEQALIKKEYVRLKKAYASYYWTDDSLYNYAISKFHSRALARGRNHFNSTNHKVIVSLVKGYLPITE